MQEKLAITVLVITLALFALVMTLYNLMTNKKEDYNQIVLSQQEYDSRTIPFKRGDIMDRNGTYLATSEKVYNLILDPKQIMSDQDSYLEPTVTALTDCFGYDRTEIMNLMQEKKDKQYVRYAKQLTYDDKQKYEKYKADQADALKKSGKSIKGIWFEDEFKRVYPYNAMG
ncbi:MAG TPA: peptidoglycan glycosyltransferase, partial [Lachnoclostridium sp.]|nr:peptidoglycan glycosyltransferase [Lachnoclostridium sp.]